MAQAKPAISYGRGPDKKCDDGCNGLTATELTLAEMSLEDLIG
jgi:hypothetical protein